MKAKTAPKKKAPPVLFAVSDLDVPICGKNNDHACDVKENPSHWVSIKLSSEVRDAINDAAVNLLVIGSVVGKASEERRKRCRAAWAGLVEILAADQASA